MNNETFIITDLGKNPEFFDELIALIEKEFHYSANHSYATDFAPLVTPLNYENCFLVIDKESHKLISHIAICPRTMIKNGCLLNVGLIGGIVTDHDHRNKGLFKMLMNHVLENFNDSIGLYILWSDLSGLYEKFSFHMAGGLIESGNGVFQDSDKPSGFQKTSFSKLNESEFGEIIKIYSEFNEKKFFTIKREAPRAYSAKAKG